jgi:hypothetical protein
VSANISQNRSVYGSTAYFNMMGYVPFNHQHVEDRKDEHEIARVFLAGHQIHNSDEGFVAKFVESYSVRRIFKVLFEGNKPVLWFSINPLTN